MVSLPGRVGRRQKEDRGRFRAGCGPHPGMNYAELVIIALLLLSIGVQVLLARSLAGIFRQGVDHLDASLAAAIQETVSNLPAIAGEAFQEPPNPLQQLLVQYLGERMKPPTLEVKEITRDEGGKFA